MAFDADGHHGSPASRERRYYGVPVTYTGHGRLAERASRLWRGDEETLDADLEPPARSGQPPARTEADARWTQRVVASGAGLAYQPAGVTLRSGRDPRYVHPYDVLPPFYECSGEQLQRLWEIGASRTPPFAPAGAWECESCTWEFGWESLRYDWWEQRILCRACAIADGGGENPDQEHCVERPASKDFIVVEPAVKRPRRG